MSLPEAFAARMRTLAGIDGKALLETLQGVPLPTALRVNPLRGAVPLPWRLEPVPWCASGWYVPEGLRPGRSPLHDAGAYYLQEASAMAVVEAAQVEPGMRVLDLCAAPGGKAGQLGAALGGSGILVANEIVPERAALLSSQLERLGIVEAAVTNERPDRLAEHFGAVFDRVLVDAPCSGEGMFRKDPQAADAWRPESNEACARRQRLILDSAAALVKPGGWLIYSTCTFSPVENEENAAWFLDTHRGYAPKKLNIPGWSQGLGQEAHCARLWPHLARGEGHFIACFERISGDMGHWPAAKPGPRDKRADDFWAAGMEGEAPEHTAGSGELVWRLPRENPQWGRLRLVRAGIPLGKAGRGYFKPHHSLAMAGRARQRLELWGDERLAAYLAGEEIAASGGGWCQATILGCPLGWGKISQGRMKNHLPAGLRRRGNNKEDGQ